MRTALFLKPSSLNGASKSAVWKPLHPCADAGLAESHEQKNLSCIKTHTRKEL